MGLTYAAVKHSYLVRNPNDIPRIVKEAFYIAESGRPGPVLIDIPKDVSGAIIEPNYNVEIDLPGYVIPSAGDPEAIARCAELLAAEKKPLLLIGHGAVISDAGRPLKALAEKLQIPIVNTLLGKGADRKTVLFALGGGVVGDMTGFAAACYMRGVPFIQVPTTLLSQVDSSVGGKTGINHPLGKNMIGAFHQPQAVLADIDTLRTLPARELAAGMAEVIKHGAIADADYFAWIEQNIAGLNSCDTDLMAEAVRGSVRIKASVVAQDERCLISVSCILNGVASSPMAARAKRLPAKGHPSSRHCWTSG